MGIPHIGSRYELRERSDGTCVCIIRTGLRSYNFEWRDTIGQWWHLHLRHAMSHDAALRSAGYIAKYSGMKWTDVCANMRPTHYS
jgi:hypothetical protein